MPSKSSANNITDKQKHIFELKSGFYYVNYPSLLAEAPILWPPDGKSQLIRKDPDAGKDWGQEEKGVTQNKIVWWHHQVNGYEFEQTPGDSEGKPDRLYSMGSQRVGHDLETQH